MTDTLYTPQNHSRRILLVVIGMTPQIVTETLYKLAVDSDNAFVPTELHIITTQEGADSARHALLGVNEGQGYFHQFCKDYGFDGIDFNDDNIHIIQDTEGVFIDDNQSTEQNKIAADFITEKVRDFTRAADSALHVSLAGGRKTMSFYAGYALSLCGRMQDRLSHVLVNSPFQFHKEFFYPRPVPERLEADNKYYSTEDAKIILADIPFVRMNMLLDESGLLGLPNHAGYQQTVDKIQRLMQPPKVKIHLDKGMLELNGFLLDDLSGADMAFYLWMCQRKLNGEAPLILDVDEFMSDYLVAYRHFVNKESGMYERVETVARKGDIAAHKTWFEQRKSKVHKKIVLKLGKRAAQAFLIQSVEHEGQLAFDVGMEPDALEILE